MSEQEKQAVETVDSTTEDFIPGDPHGIVVTTDFGRELLAIRNRAIAKGMKVLCFKEAMAVLEEIRRN
jgi:hypothetical protein